jgi:dienelactone hydrolase
MQAWRHSCAAFLLLPLTAGSAAEPTVADRALAAYFAAEVRQIADTCLADVHTLADWQAQREERRRQLFDMLGLWPLPARTPLQPVVTGTVEHDAFTVEKLHFQSLPGLYVTANFYLPKERSGPVPAILYVCGHAMVKTNNVSCGNKTAYQHHGAWFARHGYACLTLDTLQLGEIEGDHHGTHRLGQWWWNSRGYTPAGVEAWNCIRALDYLETRPEVDARRVGMTGRSGGGSYSWTAAALDERIQAAAPVAGITDLHNHVVDGAVEGHCDCMFFLNAYRWDFALNAALLAPRPLLLVNTDTDSIFPLDGVLRVHAETRRIYRLYDADAKLGLVISPGGHRDTQDLQVPVFRWFNQHLKGEDPLLTQAASKWSDPLPLRVFDTLPADQRNTRIQREFVPVAAPPSLTSEAERAAVREQLRERVFGGWPQDPAASASPLGASPAVQATATHDGLELRVIAFESQPHVPLTLYALSGGSHREGLTELRVVDTAGWLNAALMFAAGFGEAVPAGVPAAEPDAEAREEFAALKTRLLGQGGSVVWFAPRGLGPGVWSGDERKQTHIRRRFMLLGQTLDGMRVWDIRQALAAWRRWTPHGREAPVLSAQGGMAVNALYAALFEPRDSLRLELRDLPASHEPSLPGGAAVEPTPSGAAATAVGPKDSPAADAACPDYLNVLRVLDVPQALAWARTHCPVTVR